MFVHNQLVIGKALLQLVISENRLRPAVHDDIRRPVILFLRVDQMRFNPKIVLNLEVPLLKPTCPVLHDGLVKRRHLPRLAGLAVALEYLRYFDPGLPRFLRHLIRRFKPELPVKVADKALLRKQGKQVDDSCPAVWRVPYVFKTNMELCHRKQELLKMSFLSKVLAYFVCWAYP